MLINGQLIQVCALCGAMVPFPQQQLHEEWHRKLDQRFAKAEDPRSAPGWQDPHDG